MVCYCVGELEARSILVGIILQIVCERDGMGTENHSEPVKGVGILYAFPKMRGVRYIYIPLVAA